MINVYVNAITIVRGVRRSVQCDNLYAIPGNTEINREKRNMSYTFAFKTGKFQYLKYLQDLSDRLNIQTI